MTRWDDIAETGSRERELLEQLQPEALPTHVALIMDGNGRWAKRRGLARIEGHRAGIKAVRRTIKLAGRLGLQVITLYAFSTENWKRPALEVRTLWGLLKEFIDSDLDSFVQQNLRMRTIGDTSRLDPSVRRYLKRAVQATEKCTGMLVQIALNYSGRHELTRMLKTAVTEARQGKLDVGVIDEDWINAHLDTAEAPDPDLLIRTSGEQRISNFLLWQLAYSELYFTPVLWPDFDEKNFLEALLAFQERERRFGGLLEDPAAPSESSA